MTDGRSISSNSATSKMRDPNRIDGCIEQLRQFWYAHPDWRLGQIVVNAAREKYPYTNDPFYLEDETMMEGLKKLQGRERAEGEIT